MFMLLLVRVNSYRDEIGMHYRMDHVSVSAAKLWTFFGIVGNTLIAKTTGADSVLGISSLQ